MSDVEVKDFAHLNRDAMMFLLVAVEDYVACRCCLLNGLFSGFQIAAQAIEKMFKAYLLFKKLPLTRSHDLKAMAVEMQQQGHIDLSKYSSIIERLQEAYKNRYPDNWDKPFGYSTDELVEIDELFFYLFESLPLPNEVKVRTPFFVYIFNKKEHLKNYSQWLCERNSPIKHNWQKLQELYRV